jgi:cobalamin biosynthesis protein CobW
LQQTIVALASEFGILRAKGRVAVAGKALPYVVQAVGRRVDGYFARDRDTVTGRLVVIGMAGLDVSAIAARLGGTLIDEDASSQG